MNNSKIIYKLFIKRCDLCSQTKITKSSHKLIFKEYELLNLTHSYTCQLEGILTKNGKHIYFIIFIDDCFDYSFVYLMKNKSKILDMFKSFVIKIKN